MNGECGDDGAAQDGPKWSVGSKSSAYSEGDETAGRVVRRYTHRHAVSRHDFDVKAAHLAAQLGEHVVSGVTLHPVQSTAVDRDNRALHVNEFVFAQCPSMTRQRKKSKTGSKA